jgi:hypothetical protein
MHNSFIQQQYVCYTIILDMLRTLACPSSGGEIAYTHHLVSSLSVDVCTVHRLRADVSPPEDGHANVRNMLRMIV